MAHGNDINSKRYFWLKLDRHFFNNARIKKLRKLAGGDTYTIIYLKLLLLSIEFNGLLVYEGIEDTFEKEMALKLEEEEENVSVTIAFLKAQGLLIEHDGDGFLPEAANSIGSETKSNVYKRERKALVGKIPTQFQPSSNQIPTEIDIDKDIEIKLDLGLIKKEKIDIIARAYSASGCGDFIPNKELVNSLLDALVEACQFETPRTYGGKQYKAEDFIKIFKSLTANDILYILDRILPHMKEIDSFDNYAISVIAECYEHRKNKDRGGDDK